MLYTIAERHNTLVLIADPKANLKNIASALLCVELTYAGGS
jgi:hypothetical protein